MRGVRKTCRMRGLGQRRRPFGIDLQRPNQAQPQDVCFEGKPGLLYEQVAKPAWGQVNAGRGRRESQRPVEMRHRIVDHALDARVRATRGSAGHERVDCLAPRRNELFDASPGGKRVAQRLENGKEFGSIEPRKRNVGEELRVQRPTGAAFRLHENEDEQPMCFETVRRVRGDGDRRRTDRHVIVGERQLAGKADGDLDRMVCMDMGIAEAIRRFQHPDAHPLSDRQLRPPRHHNARISKGRADVKRTFNSAVAFKHVCSNVSSRLAPPIVRGDMTAADLAYIGCGLLVTTGMATGLWKYRCMITSDDAQAPVYVDICHRAALLYSFAALILAAFAERSAWIAVVDIVAVAVPLFFFMTAVAAYALHGLLRDTDNQLRRPHQFGKRHVHGRVMTVYMYALTIGEIGGFLVLFAGFLVTLLRQGAL